MLGPTIPSSSRGSAILWIALPDATGLVDSERDRSIADPFVIAVARVRACCVVTGEKSSGNPKRPKIPNVCDHFKVRYINLLQFMREQKWQFTIR